MAGVRPWLRLARLFSSATVEASSSPSSITVADFLKSIGKGVEAHADKIANEVTELDELVLIRRMRLKKIGVPCQQRKMILRHTEMYRQNLWKPKIAKS